MEAYVQAVAKRLPGINPQIITILLQILTSLLPLLTGLCPTPTPTPSPPTPAQLKNPGNVGIFAIFRAYRRGREEDLLPRINYLTLSAIANAMVAEAANVSDADATAYLSV